MKKTSVLVFSTAANEEEDDEKSVLFSSSKITTKYINKTYTSLADVKLIRIYVVFRNWPLPSSGICFLLLSFFKYGLWYNERKSSEKFNSLFLIATSIFHAHYYIKFSIFDIFLRRLHPLLFRNVTKSLSIDLSKRIDLFTFFLERKRREKSPLGSRKKKMNWMLMARS